MPFENGPYMFNEIRIGGAAPKKPGVYGIHGKKMVYVGQSENIHDRLKQHYGDMKHCIWKRSPGWFFYDLVSGGEYARRKREKQRIDEYDPPCNKA